MDLNDPDAVQKAKDKWERVSRKYAHLRNKGKGSTTTETRTITQSGGGGGGGGNQTATINFGG